MFKEFRYGVFPDWTVEEILGTPLPELDPVYDCWPEFFIPDGVRAEIAPHLLARLFTLEELAMARCLPATAAEVAEQVGCDSDTVEETLRKLVSQGKITVKEGRYFKLTPFPGIYWDYLIFAFDSSGAPIDDEMMKTLKLARVLKMDLDEYPEGQEQPQAPSRCIPKYEAIKNLPGVMDCENIRTMVLDSLERGEFTMERCWCRVGNTLWEKGVYNEETAVQTCKSGIYEGQTPLEGHCLLFGPTARHYRETLNAPTPTREDALRMLDEIEAHNLIILGPNSREFGNACTCDYCACYPNGRYEEWDNLPSRFKPVTDLDECVRCGKCVDECQLGAIEMDSELGPVTDLDVCLGCGNCVVFCSHEAKEMEVCRSADWIPGGEMHLFLPGFMPPMPALGEMPVGGPAPMDAAR